MTHWKEINSFIHVIFFMFFQVWDGTRCPHNLLKVITEPSATEGPSSFSTEKENLIVNILVYDNHVEFARQLKVRACQLKQSWHFLTFSHNTTGCLIVGYTSIFVCSSLRYTFNSVAHKITDLQGKQHHAHMHLHNLGNGFCRRFSFLPSSSVFSEMHLLLKQQD